MSPLLCMCKIASYCAQAALYSLKQRRFTLALLLWMCNVCLYLARTCMSVAVLEMYGDDEIEGNLLSAFYWGYAVSQPFLGVIAQRWNAKWLLFAAVFVWSVASAGVALVGNSSEAVPAIFALRVLVGLAEAANYPSQMQLLSVWAPYEERSRFWSFVATGEAIGTILALGAGPVLVNKLGWRSIFYVTSAIGGAWAIIFGVLTASHPERHPRISAAELMHIQATRPPRPPPVSVPYVRILTNRPFLALVATHCAYNWGYYVGLSWVSKFFDSKYGVDYAQLGALSIAPYLVLFATTSISGVVADGLENRCGASATRARKLVNSLGMGGGALGFAFLAIVCGPPGLQPSSRAYVAAACLSIATGMGGFAASAGYWATFVDLSPRHSQILLALSNSVASVPGIIGVSLTGSILSSSGDDWRIIFIIAGAVEFGGALLFLAAAEARDQHYDDAAPRGCLWRASGSRRPAVANADSRRAKLLSNAHDGAYLADDLADAAPEADEEEPEPPQYSAAAASSAPASSST